MRPATGSANFVELPTSAPGAGSASRAASKPASSVVSALRWSMDADTVVASSWRSPFTPMSHQKMPCAPSTIDITA